MKGTSRVRSRVLALASTAALLALTPMLATAPATASPLAAADQAAPAVAAEVDEAATWRIWAGLSLAPGASAVGGWNNTPPGHSYFVDVRPIATTVTTACQMEVERTWRVQHWNADNTRELEVWWRVKNVGTAACKADVYLSAIS